MLVVTEELFVILAGDGYFHNIHPDGESGLGAGFLVAERLTAVKTDPDAAGDGRTEAEEPGVGVVAGGAGFAAKGDGA